MVTSQKYKQRQPKKKQPVSKPRLYYIWACEYCRQLFSLSFDRFVVLRVLPVLYAISLMGLIGSLSVATVLLFMSNVWYGAAFLLFAVPPLMLIGATILRGFLELYLAIFRVAQHADELTGIHHTLNRVSCIAEDLQTMVSATRPFWSFFASSNTATVKRRKEQHSTTVQARTLETKITEAE